MTKTNAMIKHDLSPGNQAWLRQVDDYLEANYARPDLQVTEIADHMELSERQFHRRIKAMTGVTPLQYVRDLRLARAKFMLERGAVDTVAQLSLEVGFLNADYFSRLFRARYGYMPYQYLKDHWL